VSRQGKKVKTSGECRRFPVGGAQKEECYEATCGGRGERNRRVPADEERKAEERGTEHGQVKAGHRLWGRAREGIQSTVAVHP